MHYRATSRWQRIAVATIFGLFFFLETGAYFDRNGTQPGELAFTSALLAVFAVLTIRAARSCTLLADDTNVIVRSLIRTRSWHWEQIDRFVVEIRLVGAYRRRVLGIRQADGKTRWLTELNSRPGRPPRRSWVDDTADALNGRLAAKSEISRASS